MALNTVWTMHFRPSLEAKRPTGKSRCPWPEGSSLITLACLYSTLAGSKPKSRGLSDHSLRALKKKSLYPDSGQIINVFSLDLTPELQT